MKSYNFYWKYFCNKFCCVVYLFFGEIFTPRRTCSFHWKQLVRWIWLDLKQEGTTTSLTHATNTKALLLTMHSSRKLFRRCHVWDSTVVKEWSVCAPFGIFNIYVKKKLGQNLRSYHTFQIIHTLICCLLI